MSAQYAEAIAEWLRGRRPMRVGEIAAHEDCPVPLPDGWEPTDYAARRAGERHCQKVTQALNAAIRKGLVAKKRRGSGPWRYYRVEGS